MITLTCWQYDINIGYINNFGYLPFTHSVRLFILEQRQTVRDIKRYGDRSRNKREEKGKDSDGERGRAPESEAQKTKPRTVCSKFPDMP